MDPKSSQETQPQGLEGQNNTTETVVLVLDRDTVDAMILEYFRQLAGNIVEDVAQTLNGVLDMIQESFDNSNGDYKLTVSDLELLKSFTLKGEGIREFLEEYIKTINPRTSNVITLEVEDGWKGYEAEHRKIYQCSGRELELPKYIHNVYSGSSKYEPEKLVMCINPKTNKPVYLVRVYYLADIYPQSGENPYYSVDWAEISSWLRFQWRREPLKYYDLREFQYPDRGE